VLLDGGRVVASGPPGDVLEPDLLSRVYQIPVCVSADPRTGALLVSPRPRTSTDC
jgi:iron complex transport system ATP-binding protein